MEENRTSGIPPDDFIALLRGAFNEGARPLTHQQAAENYPLTKYAANINMLASKWPHADCARAVYCAYHAGQKAALHAQQNHPGTSDIEGNSLQQGCQDLERVGKRTRGPVCQGD